MQRRKVRVVFIGMVVVVNSTMGSSLPSNAIPIISSYFHITNSSAEILPISMYLVGYILGPLLWGPLSETYGRKVIMTSTFVFFTIFTMACAVAPNWGSLLFFRLATGINASSPIAVIGGVYADMYDNPVTRGRAMSVFIGVSPTFSHTHSPCQTNVPGNLRGATDRASPLWIYRSRPRLALGLLGRSYHRRSQLGAINIPPRNLRSRAPLPPRQEAPQIHPKCPNLRPNRTREKGLEANGNRHTHPPAAHVLLRAHRASNLPLPLPRIRYLLHVF